MTMKESTKVMLAAKCELAAKGLRTLDLDKKRNHVIAYTGLAAFVALLPLDMAVGIVYSAFNKDFANEVKEYAESF